MLNRFCVQAVIGHPLTVYGEGGQTRGFLNIRDTLQCVELAVANPAELGEYRVFNQFTEQFSVAELAELVKRAARRRSATRSRSSASRTRGSRPSSTTTTPTNTKLHDLGLEPHLLGEELVRSMLGTIERHRDRVIERAILPRTRWKPGELGPRCPARSSAPDKSSPPSSARKAAQDAGRAAGRAARRDHRRGRANPRFRGPARRDPPPVAREANVPLAATTYYFSSKDEILTEALEVLSAAEVERISGLAAEIGTGAKSQEEVAAALGKALIPEPDEAERRWLAQFEIYVEAARNPALRAGGPAVASGLRGPRRVSLRAVGAPEPERRAPHRDRRHQRDPARPPPGARRRPRGDDGDPLRLALCPALERVTASPVQSPLMRAADALCEALKAEGVEHVFGIPGGANLPTYDALYDADLIHIQARHEQGAGHAAEGYAKASGRVGVAFATSGPGATNLVTSIADAMMDSVPTVFITGQVRTDLIGTDGFQEADVTGITLPVVKHSFLVHDPRQIPEYIHAAFHIASTGRPGPVLVDVPRTSRASTSTTSRPTGSPNLPGYKPPTEGNIKQIRVAAQGARQRPPAGHLRRRRIINANASEEFREFCLSDRSR